MKLFHCHKWQATAVRPAREPYEQKYCACEQSHTKLVDADVSVEQLNGGIKEQ